MKDIVEYIVKQLVKNKDAVSIEETNGPEGVQILLTVAPQDMGIIIGKHGQTIKAIRKLILVKAINDGVRVNLQLNDQAGSEDSGNSEDQKIRESEKSGSSDNQSPSESSEA